MSVFNIAYVSSVMHLVANLPSSVFSVAVYCFV